ncbi:hypothetical protein GCM10009608_33330 [Pseudonocardia alaniniphila]
MAPPTLWPGRAHSSRMTRGGAQALPPPGDHLAMLARIEHVFYIVSQTPGRGADLGIARSVGMADGHPD